MPSSTEVAAFQALIIRLAGLAVADSVGLLRDADPRDVADALEVYPQLLDPYLAASAQLTAEWYHNLAPDRGFAVEPTGLPNRGVLVANANWALTQPDPVLAIGGAAERQVFKTSRDTVMLNAERENVRFARYASATACGWCRVLATRGAVYRSAENAVKGHDNCHCIAVPERAGNPYVPPDYVAGWLDEYNTARAEVGSNLNDLANKLRRTTP